MMAYGDDRPLLLRVPVSNLSQSFIIYTNQEEDSTIGKSMQRHLRKRMYIVTMNRPLHLTPTNSKYIKTITPYSFFRRASPDSPLLPPPPVPPALPSTAWSMRRGFWLSSRWTWAALPA